MTLVAQATLALAVVAVLGLLLSSAGLWIAGRQATATRQSVDQNSEAIALQRQEVDIVRRQLGVVETQMTADRQDRQDQREAASPWLRVQATQLSGAEVLGSIEYAHGLALATDIEIWVRFRDVFYIAKIDFVAPGERNRAFVARPFQPDDLDGKPLPDLRLPIDQNDWWIGAIWHSQVAISRIYCGQSQGGVFVRTDHAPMQVRWKP